MSERHQDAPAEPSVKDTVTHEIGRLVGLVRRLELENASLREELSRRPAPA